MHTDLPREGVGSDDSTRELLELARPLPGTRALDIACGPGRSALVLAVTAVDIHEPFLDRLRAAVGDRPITVEHARISALEGAVPADVLAAHRAEIDLRHRHPGDYGYTGFVLRL